MSQESIAAVTAATTTITTYLLEQVIPFIVNTTIACSKKLRTAIEKNNAYTYQSPSELLHALKNKDVKDGAWVTLQCKPSMFGPFLKNHFISPINGMQSGMRLGPRIISGNRAMAMIADISSHLMPVGLYKPVAKNINQIYLYPPNTNVHGFMSAFPIGCPIVEHIPAICRDRHLEFCHN